MASKKSRCHPTDVSMADVQLSVTGLLQQNVALFQKYGLETPSVKGTDQASLEKARVLREQVASYERLNRFQRLLHRSFSNRDIIGVQTAFYLAYANFISHQLGLSDQPLTAEQSKVLARATKHLGSSTHLGRVFRLLAAKKDETLASTLPRLRANLKRASKNSAKEDTRTDEKGDYLTPSYSSKSLAVLRRQVMAHENSNVLRRLFNTWFSNIGSIQRAYYTECAKLAVRQRQNQTPLSDELQHAVNNGSTTFTRDDDPLSHVFNGLKASMREPAKKVRPLFPPLKAHPIKIGKALSKAVQPPVHLPTSMQLEKHAEFNGRLAAFKKAMRRVIQNAGCKDFSDRLSTLKKMRRELSLFSHPDRQVNELKPLATSNNQRFNPFFELFAEIEKDNNLPSNKQKFLTKMDALEKNDVTENTRITRLEQFNAAVVFHRDRLFAQLETHRAKLSPDLLSEMRAAIEKWAADKSSNAPALLEAADKTISEQQTATATRIATEQSEIASFRNRLRAAEKRINAFTPFDPDFRSHDFHVCHCKNGHEHNEAYERELFKLDNNMRELGRMEQRLDQMNNDQRDLTQTALHIAIGGIVREADTFMSTIGRTILSTQQQPSAQQLGSRGSFIAAPASLPSESVVTEDAPTAHAEAQRHPLTKLTASSAA